MTPLTVLRASIRLARLVERTLPQSRLNNRKVLVGFGFLVRQRRLAHAIATLGAQHAYEGRMLLRSMIEILFNHSWIRYGKGPSRAIRFLRYEPLERRVILADVAAVMSTQDAATAHATYTKDRTDTRHLFRLKDSRTGERRWAKSWATQPSLEARLIANLEYEAKRSGKPRTDKFLYGLYRWTSSSIHGGPVSLSEVLRPIPNGVAAKRQPERDPTAQLKAAALILLATVDRLTTDARNRRPFRLDLERLLSVVMKRGA